MFGFACEAKDRLFGCEFKVGCFCLKYETSGRGCAQACGTLCPATTTSNLVPHLITQESYLVIFDCGTRKQMNEWIIQIV